MDLIRTAKVRHVCDAGNATARVPCSPAYARTEGGAESLIADVNGAYDYAGVTYDFYAALGRDSIDGAGMPIVSTVRYCAGGCPLNNAYWNGDQMVYGLSYSTADDVVAHELTHGVTDYTSQLVYWYQSGAINEAMSDIMGEFVDLSNPGSGATADTAANRWLIGEDLPIGAIRDMENPPAFNDPDKISSPFYATGSADYGGVHTNSGVVNKTAFLISDGGAFNGQTVTGIGLSKSAWLWYQTELLLRFSSDFGDLAKALDSSCSMLVTLGTAGFTGADCAQVARATLATELRTEPANVTVPAYCTSGAPLDVFNDGFDGGPAANWTIGRTLGPVNLWYGSSQTSPDGTSMHGPNGLSTNARGVDSSVPSDSTMAMTDGVVVPAGESYLYFDHWYDFEANQNAAYDGGIVEYSVGGAWTDAGTLTAVNGYSGTLDNHAGNLNPLKGRQAFVASSNGPVSTRISLASLAGQTVRFRFRLATDNETGSYGWYIDSARIYGCSAGAPTVGTVAPATGAVAGGTAITVTGVNLAGATGVTIGGVAATDFTVVDSTTVTAVTPARAASIVDVKVATPAGMATKSAAFAYAASAPAITGVSPSSGAISGGTTITITGADLTGTSSVTVGGVLATGVTVVSATQVTARVPAHAAGTVAVALATPAGATSSAGAFAYVAPPTIAGVSPSSGMTSGGTTITITGADLTGTSNVAMGGLPVTSFTVVSGARVTAVTPAHAAGTVAVSLTTPGGTTTSVGAFTYTAPATEIACPTIPSVAVSSAAAPATPAAATPPGSGAWTTNTTSDVVRAQFVYKAGTTYTIKAVRGTTTRAGTCRRVGVTITCTVKAPTGRWRVTVTPKVNGKLGTAISRTIRT
ncbi:MAG: IPT/TIG domain-containing protein [Gaiellales bacterium]